MIRILVLVLKVERVQGHDVLLKLGTAFEVTASKKSRDLDLNCVGISMSGEWILSKNFQ